MSRGPISRLVPLASVVLALAAAAHLPVRAARTALPYVPGEVLVHFKAESTGVQRQNALVRAGARAVRAHLATGDGDPGVHQVVMQSPVADAMRMLRQDPAVDYAEPNWICTPLATSNDPLFADGTLWDMCSSNTTPANPYGTGAAEAWAAGLTGSSQVCVGIIDEGIQYTHPDLAANMWTNPADGADGLDNDGNGLPDDIHGWNFHDNNNQIFTPGGDTHGTHVAGTIGGVGGNGAGVAGINWKVSLISGKFISGTGTTADATRAIDYMTSLKVKHGVNIVALNNSWGGSGYSQTLHDAIIRAAKQNILFVAAAGNAGSDNSVSPFYPACYDTTTGTSTESGAGYNSVISVAAIDNAGNLASFSNYGSTNVHIAAPGVHITSTYPTDSYYSLNGTSMAAPHVSGAAALYASAHPGATGQEIRNAILSSATPTPSLAGRTVTGGRLNVAALMTGSAPVTTPTPDPTPDPTPTPAPAPKLSAISPSKMNTGSKVTVTLTGTGFASGATVTFTSGSGSTPLATGVMVQSATKMTAVVTCARNATRKYRYWTVVVANKDGQSAKLVNAFGVR